MSKFKRILVPFDFSKASINALDYTMGFVGYERPIDILVLEVKNSTTSASSDKEAEEDFEKILLDINKRTKSKPKFLSATGNLIETLLKTQLEQEIDLTIMGTMGSQDSEEAITNTSTLVLEADGPVISVPYGTEVQVPKKIALVLGKEEIEQPKVLGVLLAIARMFDAQVHVLTIYKESVWGEKVVVESNENTLEYYLEHFYDQHHFSKNQDIEKGILDYIDKKDIDLLAILPRNHAQKTKPSEGRLTKLLTLHSRVPVLTLD